MALLCLQVGDLLIAFCKDFSMSYERLLRAVAVIVADKAETDDILLKVYSYSYVYGDNILATKPQ